MTSQSLPLIQASDLHKYIVHDAPLKTVWLHQATCRGLPYGCASYLEGLLDLETDRLVDLLGISRTTLRRRETSGQLKPAESDRVIRIVRVVRSAYRTFGTVKTARIWLARRHEALYGAVPLELMETHAGCDVVQKRLEQIE